MHTDIEPWIRDREHGTGRVLIPRSGWRANYKDILLSENISALRLSYSAGFRGNSVEFLTDLPFLTSLEIYSFDVRDISPIKHLAQLEVLGLEVKSVKVFESWSAPLRVAILRWCKDMSFVLDRDTIEYLNIVNYPYENLQPLANLTLLQRLSLTSRKLKTLHGIDKLPALAHLDLHACPNLLSVDDARTKSSIKHLEIQACRYVSKELLVEKHE
jgi:Leucine-rich repeat (LRR) protein